jgi:hypothetical protein
MFRDSRRKHKYTRRCNPNIGDKKCVPQTKGGHKKGDFETVNNRENYEPWCMTDEEYESCSINDGEVKPICPISLKPIIDRKDAVKIPGQSVCYDRDSLREWIVKEIESNKEPRNPLTRVSLNRKWILKNTGFGVRGRKCRPLIKEGGKIKRKSPKKQKSTKTRKTSKKRTPIMKRV